MVRAAVSLCGIELDNPVIPASGTFGYGYTFAELYDIDCLGTFSFKGTTREQRLGNAQPRIAEAPGGMLNAVGLQNPGVDAVIAEELPRLKQVFHKPVMANVSGFSIEEYVEVCRKLDACEQVGWLEVNISCPNVHGGGLAFGTDPKAAASVTRAVKAAVKKPVIVKLSPNVTSIADIARACEDAGADAAVCVSGDGTRHSAGESSVRDVHEQGRKRNAPAHPQPDRRRGYRLHQHLPRLLRLHPAGGQPRCGLSQELSGARQQRY